MKLTTQEHKLLESILRNVNETRSHLSVAEQINAAYDDEGEFDKELVARTEATFDGLLSKLTS